MRVFRYQHEGRRRDSSVDMWTWTRSRGLRVHYKDGMHCKASYTLPELLAQPWPESVVEVTDARIPHPSEATPCAP